MAPLRGAGADTSVYFTAINDSILNLSDDTMPVRINGTLYIPLWDFNQASLYTYAKYDNRVATIYGDDRTLTFELGSGNTFDDKGKGYSFSAIYYNSGVYVPVAYTCQFFGFKFSINMTNTAPFLRIRNSNASVSDEDFAKIASLKMQSMFNIYMAAHTQTIPSPAVTPTPYTPTPTPSASSEPGHNHADVYISIRGIGDSTVSILNSLTYYGYKACFFVTADEIRKNPDLIRRIAGSGQNLGILCSQNIQSDYNAASSLLREAVSTRTILISLDCAYNQDLANTAGSLGLLIWSDSRLTVFGYNNYASAGTIDRFFESTSSRLDFSVSGESPSLLREALSDIYDDNYTVKTINETASTYLNS